jgi:hypothetical protein
MQLQNKGDTLDNSYYLAISSNNLELPIDNTILELQTEFHGQCYQNLILNDEQRGCSVVASALLLPELILLYSGLYTHRLPVPPDSVAISNVKKNQNCT